MPDLFTPKKQPNNATPVIIQPAEEADKKFVRQKVESQAVEMAQKMKGKMDKLVENSNKILFRTSAVFPFDLFPDEVVVDPYQVNIIHRSFFGNERIHGAAIKDIEDVFVDTGPLFAALRIVDKGYVENVITIKYLPRKDAIKARRIIQGLVLASKEGVDMSQVDIETLVKKTEAIGTIRHAPMSVAVS